MDEAVTLARDIVEAERMNIERLAEVLLEKETIFSEDVEAVLGKSAQQIAKEALEAATAVEATDEAKDKDNGSDEVTYTVVPAESNDNDKTE